MADPFVNPFAFEPALSPVGNVHPLAKFLALVSITAAAMRVGTWPLLVLFALGLAGQRGLARQNVRYFMPILMLILFSGLVRGLFPQGGGLFDTATIPESLRYGLRLVTVFLFSRVFYATTQIAAIGDWMTAAVRYVLDASRCLGKKAGLLRKPKDAVSKDIIEDPSMLFSLSLLFLPRMFDTAQRIREAGEVRGLSLSGRNAKRSLQILERLVISGLLQAQRTAAAMELRAYTPRRTLRLVPFRPRDWALMALALALCAIR